MWPAKLPGEGALLYDTCSAMCEVMRELGVAIDGGKDSLSMAARVGEETVKAPGIVTIYYNFCCQNVPGERDFVQMREVLVERRRTLE